MNIRRSLTLLCTLALCWPALGRTQAIYKSVDAQGNVTYSSTKPTTAVEVQPVAVPQDLIHGVDPEAQARRHDMERQAAEMQQRREEQREQTAQKAAVAEAERRLKAARDGLSAAQRRSYEARQSLDRGDRPDSEVYREQVARQERKLREAERMLQEAKAKEGQSQSAGAPAPAPIQP
jgi:hypothetical protein